MSIKPHRRTRGYTLIELLFGMVFAVMVTMTTVSFMTFTSFSFNALYNYVELDDKNRVAIDKLTRDVRQANRVLEFSETRLVLEDSDAQRVTYVFNPVSRHVVRIKGYNVQVLLTECDWVRFVIGQRNPVGGSYEVFPAATPATAKVVNVSWVCSRSLKGRKANTESVQTARIVIRKQGS